MKFRLTKSSDWNFDSNVEINSIDELMEFAEENGGQLVVSTKEFNREDWEATEEQGAAGPLPGIEIYDYWRE